jgi:hypothetical protein
MFTALMSLGLVALVVVSGLAYSERMDELFRDSPKPDGKVPRN